MNKIGFWNLRRGLWQPERRSPRHLLEVATIVTVPVWGSGLLWLVFWAVERMKGV